MGAYRLASGSGVVRTSDNAVIPIAPGNADYQAYQAWLADGNAPDPIPSPTTDQLLATFKASVQAALDKSDITMLRVAEATTLGLTTPTTADVVVWVMYRRDLRSLLSATIPGTLPSPPAYPANT